MCLMAGCVGAFLLLTGVQQTGALKSDFGSENGVKGTRNSALDDMGFLDTAQR